MSNKTRKHIWPVSLVMSIAIIGALAAFLVLAGNPGEIQAHGAGDHPNQNWPACADMTTAQQAIHDNIHAQLGAHGTMDPCSDDMSPGTGGNGNGGNGVEDTSPCVGADACTTSSSTSGSATVEVKLTIEELNMPVAVGGSIVLYLEDDFAEPDSISASDVYFVVSSPVDVTTGNGGRVYSTVDPVISNSDYFTPDKKDIAIQIFVPDLCPNATDNCEGDDGLNMNDTVSVVVTKGAGIKNPSEAGTHSTGYNVLPATHTGSVPGTPMATDILPTVRKIGLDDVDNKRGYELTVTGSGFKDGTTAAVYALHIMGTEPGNAMRNAYLWNALNCGEMIAAVPSDAAGNMGTGMDNPYCAMYNDDFPQAQKDVVMALDFSKGAAEEQLCDAIIRDGTNVGAALVGSDDKVAVTFEVTAPTFGPGQTNHICMVDGTGGSSYTDVEDFNLQASIKVVPSSVATGDTVNVFAQDYSNEGGIFNRLIIAGSEMAPNDAYLFHPMSNMRHMDFVTDTESISRGAGSVTFEVPGGYRGVLKIEGEWCTGSGDNQDCIKKDSTITIAGAELNASKTEVLPNDTITITGNGFGTQTCIPVQNVTLDDVPVMIHDDSTAERCSTSSGKGVEVSNSGQFVATVILWPVDDDSTNPTLIPGTHELNVEDNDEYEADISLTIAEPTIMVSPDIAGPRDYITVTGANWPVDNLDNTLSRPITVVVEDYQAGRSYPLYADSVGRISAEHRIHRKVAIPDTVQVKASYDSGKVVKIGSFSVPASTITVSPNEGQPGDMVTLTASSMPVYTEADYVEIGGTTYSDPGVNTDRDGNITVEDVLIPGLDPGVYSVVINVDGTIAIGEVNVLAESSARGAPAELPGATESLGDNLVAIFHFDDVGKEWSFYDPRSEFAELNTLTEMVNGEAYWILVSETVDDVVLNNKVRSLTCRGSDCWNLEVW